MNRSVTVGLAMLAGAALGAAAVEGLHAQAKPPGTAQVLGCQQSPLMKLPNRASPSLRSASTRPWRATSTSSSPTKIGLTNPDLVIDPAICAGCSSEWVRALGACGINRSSGQNSIVKKMTVSSLREA